MVGEAYAYVQDESLKAWAVFLVRLTNSPVTRRGRNMPDWRDCERLAKRAIEDAGYVVHDANILFHKNCPNIGLVVYGPAAALYVQVKASVLPATKGSVTVCGAPWTEGQLLGRLP